MYSKDYEVIFGKFRCEFRKGNVGRLVDKGVKLNGNFHCISNDDQNNYLIAQICKFDDKFERKEK